VAFLVGTFLKHDENAQIRIKAAYGMVAPPGELIRSILVFADSVDE